MAMLLAEKTFAAGDTLINYAEGPESEGPAILMLHGMTSDWLGFRDLMSRLAGDWRSYACDLRGHGKSGRARDGYRLLDYARDIRQFMANVSGPTVLLGHSLGALTALVCAAEEPVLTRGLVLIDPPVYVRNTPVGIHPGVEDWFGWVYETMKDNPSLDEVMEACRLREPDADEGELQTMAVRVSRVDPAAVEAALGGRMGEGADMEAAFRKLPCPMLVLRGEWKYGACVRDEDADWIHAAAPAARIVQIRGGTHGFLWEKPDETFALIKDFLQPLA